MLKVALVHDDLVQWGGAERVLLAISEVFPEAPIYTSVFDSSNPLLRENFKNKKIITSFMQKIPGWKSLYRALLPLYPIAFEQFDFSEYDLVISQTTKFAKAIITKPETIHICYCHTPPRFLWDFSGEKVSKLLSPYLSFLRVYDQISAKRVDYFLAGSENAKGRIKKIYQADAQVLLPFVEMRKGEDRGYWGDKQSFSSSKGGYYLIIARLNAYKRVDLAVEAFGKNGKRLIVIGKGPQLFNLRSIADKNIEFLQSVPEMVLWELICGCDGLIVTAEEDFGLTSLEAQAVGKGVIAYGVGGSLETVIENKTGVFFKEPTARSLQDAIERFEDLAIDPEDCNKNAQNFSKTHFQQKLSSLVASIV